MLKACGCMYGNSYCRRPQHKRRRSLYVTHLAVATQAEVPNGYVVLFVVAGGTSSVLMYMNSHLMATCALYVMHGMSSQLAIPLISAKM